MLVPLVFLILPVTIAFAIFPGSWCCSSGSEPARLEWSPCRDGRRSPVAVIGAAMLTLGGSLTAAAYAHRPPTTPASRGRDVADAIWSPG